MFIPTNDSPMTYRRASPRRWLLQRKRKINFTPLTGSRYPSCNAEALGGSRPGPIVLFHSPTMMGRSPVDRGLSRYRSPSEAAETDDMLEMLQKRPHIT